MIQKPTVLILGAGAGADCGFPLGRQLLVQICQAIDGKRGTPTRNHLEGLGFPPKLIESFRYALDFSGQPSVDAFLEYRPEFIDVGKAAIACHLIPVENAEIFVRSSGRSVWYEYLYQHLRAPKNDFKRNKLSVLTYNYDRSLEYYLSGVLRHSYGLDDSELAELVNSIPIVHLHGQLGQLPVLTGKGRGYYPDITTDVLKLCMDEIKIIHEALPTSPEFERAGTILREAEVVCFLGFGYHEQNMARLQLERFQWNKKKVYCSFYGLKPKEQEVIMGKWLGLLSPYGTHVAGSEDQDALRFLRERVPLV